MSCLCNKHSFSLLSNILLYKYSTIWLSVLLVMDLSSASNLGLSWIMHDLFWTSIWWKFARVSLRYTPRRENISNLVTVTDISLWFKGEVLTTESNTFSHVYWPLEFSLWRCSYSSLFPIILLTWISFSLCIISIFAPSTKYLLLLLILIDQTNSPFYD